MRLINIEIKNFGPFQEANFGFKNGNIFPIVALNNAGKTSLLNAVKWCLYGNLKVGKGTTADTTTTHLKYSERCFIKKVFKISYPLAAWHEPPHDCDEKLCGPLCCPDGPTEKGLGG